MPLLSTFGAASARSFGGIGAAAAGAGLDIDEAFSTYLYDGNNSTQTITNNIDLSGEGGMVWIKARNTNLMGHIVTDTERGAGKALIPNVQNAEDTNHQFGYLSSFNSNGFTVTNGSSNADRVNNSSYEYASWTFRKAPKFFDVVTYTGNFTAGKTVSHNLGSVPGMILIKDTSNTRNWIVYHRSIGEGKFLKLNLTDAEASNTFNFNNTAPTSTQFTLGESSNTNTNGANYVAYLFAHNNSDGEFGPDSDADIIKCGSYTGNTSGTEVNLGFEPQFVMIKKSTDSESWYVYDSMRGVVTGGGNSQDKKLRFNSSGAEGAVASPIIAFSANGFILESTDNEINGSGTYIYMAIRRGPLAEPTSATDVFAIDTQSQSSAPYAISNFPVDFAIRKDVDGSSTDVHARLTQGQGMFANSTNAEGSDNIAQFDYQNGYLDNTSQDSTRYAWMWKRAPSYFDVVAYTGTGSATTVSHNLTVAPEMMWVKPRETGLASSDWWVFHKDLSTPADDSLVLNSTGAENTGNGALLWNSTMPTSSVFSLGSYNGINQSGRDFIAYLFATLAGVSKVGSYTGTGAGNNQNIDCGFSSGARFVLIKRTDTTGSWYLFDSVRGINASAVDPYLQLNTTDAEASNFSIEPLSSGFTIVQDGPTELNISGSTYIFYAIA